MKAVMKTMSIVAVLSAGMGLAGYAAAQAITCNPNGNQQELNACAAQDLKSEDAKLNKVYKAYTTKLDTAHRTKLKAVQVNWIKFRDSACAFEVSDYKGGSIYPMELSSCLSGYTKQRRIQLETLLEDSNSR